MSMGGDMGGGGMGGGNPYGGAPNPYAPPQGAPQAGPPGYGQPPQGYGAGAPQMGGEYEFTPEENLAVTDLASKMRFVGTVSIVFGVIMILGGFAACGMGKAGAAGNGAGNVIQGVFTIIVGVWTRSASGAFQRIVDTTGSDIANLMLALGELRRIYGLQRILIMIALVLIALAFVFGILAAFLLMGRASHG